VAAAASVEASKEPQGQQQNREMQQEDEQYIGTDDMEEGAARVETGTQDGVRIEFVGRAEGTIPEPERPALSSSPMSSSSPGGESDGVAAQKSAAGSSDAISVKFELLTCGGDGAGNRDGKEGGLTVKSVWDHLRGKLEKSAERVCTVVYVVAPILSTEVYHTFLSKDESSRCVGYKRTRTRGANLLRPVSQRICRLLVGDVATTAAVGPQKGVPSYAACHGNPSIPRCWMDSLLRVPA